VRGVDEFRGTELWIQQVPAAPSPVLSGWTPTVGAGVVAVPHDSTGQSTTILDANTGDVIDVVNGEVIALGDALVQRDPGDPNPVALVDPRSGERVTIADGAPVWVRGLDPGLTAASGVLMASDTTTGPAAKLWLVDLPSGTVRWTVDYRPPIARDDRTVLVTDGDELVALDAADGTDRWRYRPPDEQLRFVAASVAGDVVVALPALADPLADVLDDEAATNDCGADPVADSATSCTNRLDALVAATAPAIGRLTVAESDDGQRFCVAAEPEPVLGDVPAMSTTAPRLETPLFGMMSDDGKPDGVYYVFAVPAGFDSNVRVLDEDGEAMPSAVGPSGNYLVVFQAVVGMIGGGFASTQRTVQLVAVNGTPLGTIDFDGFGTQSGSDMSDFDACLQRNGVVRELPQPGSTSRPTPDVATSVLLRAWTACEDHFFSYLRAAQGFTEEFTANLRAETDCLAEAGWFQHLGFEVDMLAWAAASTDCQRETPAYAALVTCLGHEGLDVSADELPGGSYPLPLAAQAWVGCRDTYARWRDDGSEAFAAVLVDFDCTAQQGWIIPLLDSVERAGAEADRVQRSC